MVRFLVNFVSPSSGRLNMTWPTNQHLWKEISFNRSQRYFWHLRALKKGTEFLARDQLLFSLKIVQSDNLLNPLTCTMLRVGPGFKPGPHRWEVSVLITLPSLHPLKYYVAQILEPHWVSSLPAFLLSLECDILPFILTNIVYILVLAPYLQYFNSILRSLFSEPRQQHVRSSHSSKRSGFKSSGSRQQIPPKRDLATKYFGEHLFSLPVGVTVSESALSTSKTRRKR